MYELRRTVYLEDLVSSSGLFCIQYQLYFKLINRFAVTIHYQIYYVMFTVSNIVCVLINIKTRIHTLTHTNTHTHARTYTRTIYM